MASLTGKLAEMFGLCRSVLSVLWQTKRHRQCQVPGSTKRDGDEQRVKLLQCRVFSSLNKEET